MLALARLSATEQGVTNAAWILGSGDELPPLGALVGRPALAAVTVANAIHLMSHER